MSETLTTLQVGTSAVALRRATPSDLNVLLELLVADQLGSKRESLAGDLAPYERALAMIDGDPGQLLVVAEDGTAVVGMFQLSFIPGLARRGALRAQIEGVRVRADYRNKGLGAAMMRWAIDEAERRDCALVQLTTDKSRTNAHRFYERLGFRASHEGMKLRL